MRRGLLASFLLASCLILAGCAIGLPPRPPVHESHAIADHESTTLGKLVAASLDGGFGSGFQLLPVGPTALETRLVIGKLAERTLDVQTFVIRPDATGSELMDSLVKAAARGVRVRLLVDDLNTAGVDAILVSLSERPNVEVRLFNPFRVGRNSLEARLMQSLADLRRINHRMHNKLFIADNAIAIFGGRNVGDDYFMRAATANFVDFDVLGGGSVVRELSETFDDYWNSEFAYPLRSIVNPATSSPGALPRPVIEPQNDAVPARLERYTRAAADLESGRLTLAGAEAHVKADLVSKIAGSRVTDPTGTVRAFIGDLMHAATKEIFVISPYYVPGKESMEYMRKLSAAGVSMKLLTNSLAATDEPMAHGGYLRYRKEMLELGVHIYELSPTLSRRAGRLARFGESFGRLHAKVIVVDRRMLFVGSMNLDARSERYNTELGVLIDSRALAEDFLELMTFETSSYRLRLNPSTNEVEWVTGEGADEKVWTSEPEASLWLRFKARLLGGLVPEGWL